MEAQSDLDQSIEQVRKMVEERMAAGDLGDIDNMTIKELRLKAFAETERLLTNDQKASIVSVIVYVAVT